MILRKDETNSNGPFIIELQYLHRYHSYKIQLIDHLLSDIERRLAPIDASLKWTITKRKNRRLPNYLYVRSLPLRDDTVFHSPGQRWI